jgi:hypothetical protein
VNDLQKQRIISANEFAANTIKYSEIRPLVLICLMVRNLWKGNRRVARPFLPELQARILAPAVGDRAASRGMRRVPQPEAHNFYSRWQQRRTAPDEDSSLVVINPAVPLINVQQIVELF